MHHSYQVTKTENAINLFLKFQEAQQKELKVEFEFEPPKYCIENISHRPRWKSRQRLGLFVWELQRREFTADTKCFVTPKIPI